MFIRIALITACLFATAAAHAVEIVRVWPEWRSEESLRRISEHLDGKENTGGEIFLRTNPESRDGMYFLVRLADAPAGDAVFELDVIIPGSADPVPFKFPASLAAGRSVYQLALTSGDWPDAKAQPIAWKVALRAADGRELAAAQSFLWSTRR